MNGTYIGKPCGKITQQAVKTCIVPEKVVSWRAIKLGLLTLYEMAPLNEHGQVFLPASQKTSCVAFLGECMHRLMIVSAQEMNIRHVEGRKAPESHEILRAAAQMASSCNEKIAMYPCALLVYANSARTRTQGFGGTGR